MILDQFPSTAEFYKTYWNKKPFIVRGGIPTDVFDRLIDGDHLAGLSLEEDIKSRLVHTQSDTQSWACDHGPFEEDHYAELGDKNWSLLVQNVEQYHTDTAELLEHFPFAPRWLMDDIMVSYSVKGGSVGPHIDSYHVFLVQGIGSREWKIGTEIIDNPECIEGIGLKVLKDGFDGETVTVNTGDIIYIPPHFGHQGVTHVDEAMTFSVGFLGPKLSEMMVEYGQYLEQTDHANMRYMGDGLDENSAGFIMDRTASDNFANIMVNSIQSDEFSIWMTEYFSQPTHEEIEQPEVRDDSVSTDKLMAVLNDGMTLYRPDHIKPTITTLNDGSYHLAINGVSLTITDHHRALLNHLNITNSITIEDVSGDNIDLVTVLYNHFVLEFH